ncbi:MAG TPA: DUF2950 family protein [Terriglobales bacterium]
MWFLREKQKICTSRPGSRLLILAAACVLALSLSACKQRESKAAEKSGEPATSAPATEANAVQRTFASPEAAGAALFEAAKAGDEGALMVIFGPEGKDVLFSGDPVKDKNTAESFTKAYSQMHRWSKSQTGGETLYIGADNFPFPIQLNQNAAGQWAFNTAAGKDEVLARRIGNDELTAIGVLSEVANAQREYFQQAHQYAQKFLSDEGQHNGLFWPVVAGQTPSPLGRLADVAKELGYSAKDKTQPFIGYHYKILTQQGDEAKGGSKDYMAGGKLTGGFAVLAWPAKYKDSGIMTFLVSKDGVIYQKDLGEKTDDLAPAIADYSPDQTWNVVLVPDSPNFPAGARTAKK